MNIYYVIIIIVAVVTWTMAIISLIAQVRTWQILKEIAGTLPKVLEVRSKKEARQMIGTHYIPREDTQKAKRLIQFLSNLTGDEEARLLVEDLKELEEAEKRLNSPVNL
jgi:hypothetical protein